MSLELMTSWILSAGRCGTVNEEELSVIQLCAKTALATNEAMTEYNRHESSKDHDNIYYEKSEIDTQESEIINGDHLGSWQGYQPTEVTEGTLSILSDQSKQLLADAVQIELNKNSCLGYDQQLLALSARINAMSIAPPIVGVGINARSVFSEHANIDMDFEDFELASRSVLGQIPVVDPILQNEVSGINGAFTVIAGGKIVGTINSGKTYSAGMFSVGFTELEMDFLNSGWILLGTDNTNYWGVSISGSDMGVVANISPMTLTKYASASGSQGVALVGDVIRVKFMEDKVSLWIKRSGKVWFDKWFEISYANYTWIKTAKYNQQFGVLKYASADPVNTGMFGNITFKRRVDSSTPSAHGDAIALANANILWLQKQTEIATTPMKNALTSVLVTSIQQLDPIGGSLSIDTNNIVTFTTDTTVKYPWVFFDKDVYKYYYSDPFDMSKWIMFAGDHTNAIGVSVQATDLGRVATFDSTGVNTIQQPTTNSAPIALGDMIRISILGDTLLVEILRSGATDWVSYYTLDLTAFSSNASVMQGYHLGIGVVGVSQIAQSIHVFYKSIGVLEATVNGIKKAVNDISVTNHASKWLGKKWGSMGDSISHMMIYQADVKLILDMGSVIDYGQDGCTIAHNLVMGRPMCERVNAMDADCDIITVMGGTNDFGRNVPLGTIDSTDTSTFYGGLKNLCDQLISRYPTTPLCFFTPTQRNSLQVGVNYTDGLSANASGAFLLDYVKVIIEVCGLYSIPVLDLHRMGGICQGNIPIMLRDGLHPLNVGHQRIANRMAPFMDNL